MAGSQKCQADERDVSTRLVRGLSWIAQLFPRGRQLPQILSCFVFSGWISVRGPAAVLPPYVLWLICWDARGRGPSVKPLFTVLFVLVRVVHGFAGSRWCYKG